MITEPLPGIAGKRFRDHQKGGSARRPGGLEAPVARSVGAGLTQDGGWGRPAQALMGRAA